MARDDERETISSTEGADGPLGAGVAREVRQLGVRDDLPVGNRAQRTHDLELERRPAVEIDVDALKVNSAPLEVRLHAVDELFRFRSTSVTDSCAFRRYRRPRGWRVYRPTLGGGLTRAPARPRACTYRRVGRRMRQLVPDEAAAVMPDLPHAPAVGPVRDARHRH